MKRFALATWLALICASASGQTSLHSGMWWAGVAANSRPDTYKIYACKGFQTQKALEVALSANGWPDRIPEINWAAHSVVLIAPDRPTTEEHLSFFGLYAGSAGLRLNYGWSIDQKLNSQALLGTTSVGFIMAGYQMLLIAYPKAASAGQPFNCVLKNLK